jgi:hypothetical protein
MSDDKSKTGPQDRERVANEQQYEIAYFAERHGLSAAEARKIIEEAGPDREKADALAMRTKQRPRR